jgi:transposase
LRTFPFDHRNDLVVERTRVINRLRWHLLELCPELERSLKRGSLDQPRVLDRVARRLRQLAAGARVKEARKLAQLARRRARGRGAGRGALGARPVAATKPQ